jgi:putative transposase
LTQFLEYLSLKHPREGFWNCYYRLRNGGEVVNLKRLHRAYMNMGLPVRRKLKKRLPQRVKNPLNTPESFNNTWSIDFMSNALKSPQVSFL